MARVALMRHGRAMARGGQALARTVGGSSTCCCEGPSPCAFYYPATMCSPGSCPTPYTVYVCGSVGCVGTNPGTFLVPAGEVVRTGVVRTFGAGSAWQAMSVPDDPAAPNVDASYIEMETGASIEFTLIDPGLIMANNVHTLYDHDPIFRHRLVGGGPRNHPYRLTIKKHGVPIYVEPYQRQASGFEFVTDQHVANFLLHDLHNLSMVIEVLPGSGPSTDGIAFSFGAAVLFLQRPFKNGQVIQGPDGRCFAVNTAVKYCASTHSTARLQVTAGLASFQQVGRGRMRVNLNGTDNDLYDIDLFRVADFNDVAARLQTALNTAIPGPGFIVTYSAGELLITSRSGAMSMGSSVRRANEAQHVWGYINMGDGYDPTFRPHGMNPATWATGDWSAYTNEATRLLGLGMHNVYGYSPWGFENLAGPGYQTGFLAPEYGGGAEWCYESGARLVEAINAVPVLSFTAAWTPVVAALKAAGGNMVFEPGAPPMVSAAGWEREVLATGADIGFATGGGDNPGTTPPPACVAYYATVRAGGTKIYLEPGERTDFPAYAPWQDGTYGTIHNLNRAALIAAGQGFFRAHPAQHKNLLLTFVDEASADLTIEQQLAIAPLWIRRGFECVVGATWNMTADQVARGVAISGDTDLFAEGLLR